jgi:hypothetical protein
MAKDNEKNESEKKVKESTAGTASSGIRLTLKQWAKLDKEAAKTGKSRSDLISEILSREGFLRVSEEKFDKMVQDLEAIKITNNLMALILEDYFERLGMPKAFDKFFEDAKITTKFK